MSRRRARPVDELLVKEDRNDGSRFWLVCTGRDSHPSRAMAKMNTRSGMDVSGPGVISVKKVTRPYPSATYAFSCPRCGREIRVKGSRLATWAGQLLAQGIDTLDLSRI